MAVKLLPANNNNINSSARTIAATLLTLFSTFCILHSSLALTNIGNNYKYIHTNKYAYDVNDDPKVNVYSENTRPIIGILSQEVSRFVQRNYPDEKYESYIAASYLKFVEGAGGRAVPIWIGQDKEYYVDIMSKINGVLLPGGSTFFNQSGGYAEASKHIYNIAIELNERGIYFPIWGTCLGFEVLIFLSSNGTDWRTECSSVGQALPLQFEKGYKDSRLFAPASEEILYYLSTFNVTVNFHIFCYTKETFAQHDLNKIWQVMSVNHDWNGVEFISTVEHRKYPFYAVQYHPEKILYEFVPNRNITHTTNAVLVSQYFANFFVNEARKNQQKFNDPTEEINTLFYNYHPVYTGAKGSSYAQLYLFKSRNPSSAASMSAEATKLRSLFTLITLFILVS